MERAKALRALLASEHKRTYYEDADGRICFYRAYAYVWYAWRYGEWQIVGNTRTPEGARQRRRT